MINPNSSEWFKIQKHVKSQRQKHLKELSKETTNIERTQFLRGALKELEEFDQLTTAEQKPINTSADYS